MAFSLTELTTAAAAVYHIIGYWAGTYGKNEKWDPKKLIRTAVAAGGTLLGLHLGHVPTGTAAGAAGLAGFGTFSLDRILRVIAPVIRKYDGTLANDVEKAAQAAESNSGSGGKN